MTFGINRFQRSFCFWRVYEAKDMRLGRYIASKFLPEHLSRGRALPAGSAGRLRSESFQYLHDIRHRQGPRLGLARAYALQRNALKARAAYADFLHVWNDADPKIPILRQARAEYDRLESEQTSKNGSGLQERCSRIYL